jgi:flagellar basal-body rod protein FlgF
MNQGLYAAYLGMRARQRALETIANNIANASTTGFKADRMLYRSIEAAEIEALRARQSADATGQATPTTEPAANAAANGSVGSDQPASLASAIAHQGRALGVLSSGMTDHSPGSIHLTGRALDVALDGDGFLVVQTPRGPRYTRAGSLTLDASGQLVTHSGDLVVGQGGPITVPPGEISIGEDGSISVKNQTVDRLKLVRFSDPRAALVKEGAALFAAADGARPAEDNTTRVVQGALETSNVNAVSEMAAMIQNGREFDSLQRSITLMMNNVGRKVAEEIGRI